MLLSRPSSSFLDPLSAVLAILGTRVTRRTRLEAAGDWALAFPALDRLKFVALLRGEQWLLLPGRAPQLMRQGDVCVLGPTPYVVASAPGIEPIDGQALYTDGCDVARLGGADVIGIGGTVTFAAPDADFLLGRLPPFMIVPRSAPGSEAVAAILALIAGEVERDALGSEIVSARLADVLLVEAFRAYAIQGDALESGWLGALTDVRIGRALRAIHGDVAQPWTVESLAHTAGMSRAAFAAEFARRVGSPPLAYLRAWRLAAARAALARGEGPVGELAARVGYTSQSAFGHAYRQAFGTSPKMARLPA